MPSPVYHTFDVSNLPASVDWVTSGDVTSVKHQAHCGGCYAFAVAGAIESARSIKGEGLESLSM